MELDSSLAAPARTPWWRVGVADVLFLLVALACLRGAGHTLLDDPGLGWHLRNIDAIGRAGGWLTTDPFTEPDAAGPRRHLTNQWLGELPYWLGWQFAGLEGIAAVNGLILGLVGVICYRTLRADEIPWPVAVLWATLVIVGTSCSWTARPNVFTILFTLLTARACVLYHEGRLTWRGLLWLVPLLAVWANVHGGFVAGLLCLGATLFIEGGIALFALDPETRKGGRGRAGGVALVTLGCVLATFVNPYGPGLYRWVLQLLGDPYFMDLHQEWQSPDFHGGGAMRFELLMLLFPALLALTARRPHLVELGLSVLWLHFALSGFRYVVLWVVVAGPLLARSFTNIPYLQAVAARLRLGQEPDSLFVSRPGPQPWVWTFVFATAVLLAAWLLQGQVARHKQEIIASTALDRFLVLQGEWRREHGKRPRLFHGYDWGGYLTWHGWPEVLNWIDDRNEVQGKARIQRYFAIAGAEADWERQLDDVDLVCIGVKVPLARELARRPDGWRERYRDDYAVIFERIPAPEKPSW